MAGTYTYTVPGDTDKDTIRFLLQDTDPHGAGEWLVTDEEIQWAYDIWYPALQQPQLRGCGAGRYHRGALRTRGVLLGRWSERQSWARG